MHSWMIAPAENETKLARVADLDADVVLLDLTGDHDTETRTAARERARDFLARRSHQDGTAAWVRINPLDTPWWRDDLVAVLPGGPAGVVLSRAADAEQVRALAAEIYELEQRSGLAHGKVRIVPQVGATPAAALAVPGFASEVHPRLAGLAWDADELAGSLGARRYGLGGQLTDPLRALRAAVVLTARAHGLMAIDTAFPRVRDAAGVRAAASAARGDGFTGMFAVHPAQVAVIAEAFASSPN